MPNKHKIYFLVFAVFISSAWLFGAVNDAKGQWEWCPTMGCYSDQDANYCMDNPSYCNNAENVFCRYTGEATCSNPGGASYCGAQYECVQESPPPPPPPEVCGDPNATNYGGSLPCTYPPPPICQDSNASNYGGALPCQYPPPPPPPQTCQDSNASNYGGSLPCTYPPPPPTGNISVSSNLSTTWCLSGPDSFCGSGTSGYYPGHNIGGYTISMNAIGDYSVTVTPAQTQWLSNGGTIAFNIVYNANPVYAPSNLSVDNSVCSKLKLTWQDNSNNEDGFIITRSISSGAESEIARVGANQTTFTDTPPATDAPYYYVVKAYKNTPWQETASNEANGFNQSCVANLSNSNKTILKVNGLPYSSSTLVHDGDDLTFQIVISNAGPAAAQINKITDTFSPTLVNIRNLAVSGGNNGGITPINATTVQFNVTGNKTVGNPNWVVSFDATVRNPVPAASYEIISNTAAISYADGEGAKSFTVKFGPILYKTGQTPGLNFREVVP